MMQSYRKCLSQAALSQLSIDVCLSKASDGSWTSKVNKEESKEMKSSKGISEHTNSYSMKLKAALLTETAME